MKNKRVLYLIAGLIMVTAVLAAIHLTTRDAVSQGTLKIDYSGQTVSVSISELDLVSVTGSVVNGKGEEKTIDAQGILLRDLFEQLQISDFTEVTAEADDAYSATVTAEEIAAPEKVYLITQEDGGVRLLVFGDANSKRQVSNIIALHVQ